MNLKDRMAGIDTNLDDLQAGLEACSRTADGLHGDIVKVDGLLKQMQSAELARSLLRHATELQTCAREQRGALQELREAIAQLQQELQGSIRAVRRPPASAADRHRTRGARRA